MVAAGLVVEILFGALGLIPDERDAKVVEASITWNYTTVLNIVFLAARGGAGRAVPAHRRPRDAADDGGNTDCA